MPCVTVMVPRSAIVRAGIIVMPPVISVTAIIPTRADINAQARAGSGVIAAAIIGLCVIAIAVIRLAIGGIGAGRVTIVIARIVPAIIAAIISGIRVVIAIIVIPVPASVMAVIVIAASGNGCAGRTAHESADDRTFRPRTATGDLRAYDCAQACADQAADELIVTIITAALMVMLIAIIMSGGDWGRCHCYDGREGKAEFECH